ADLIGDVLVLVSEGVERIGEALDGCEAALRIGDLLERLDARDVAGVVEGRLAVGVDQLAAHAEDPQPALSGGYRIEPEPGGNAAGLFIHLVDRAEKGVDVRG